MYAMDTKIGILVTFQWRDTLAFQDEALSQDMQSSIHAVVQKVYIPVGIVGNKAVLD